MRHDIGGARCLHIADSDPAPTVMALGIGSVNCSQYQVEAGTMKRDFDKPPYRMPSMAEIAAIPWNGLTVASTQRLRWFVLGYRMAVPRGLANEFAAGAGRSRQCADCSSRDIRQVQPEEMPTRHEGGRA